MEASVIGVPLAWIKQLVSYMVIAGQQVHLLIPSSQMGISLRKGLDL